MAAGVQAELRARTPPEPRRRRGRVAPLLLAAGLYLLGALALDHRVLPQLGTATTGWVTADSDSFVSPARTTRASSSSPPG
jgi:hypothetical protein